MPNKKRKWWWNFLIYCHSIDNVHSVISLHLSKKELLYQEIHQSYGWTICIESNLIILVQCISRFPFFFVLKILGKKFSFAIVFEQTWYAFFKYECVIYFKGQLGMTKHNLFMRCRCSKWFWKFDNIVYFWFSFLLSRPLLYTARRPHAIDKSYSP